MTMDFLKDKHVKNAILIGGLCSISYLGVYVVRNILGTVTPQMLGENGLSGLLGYIIAFGYILWDSIRKYFENKNPYNLMIIGSTTTLLLQGMTEYNFGNSSVMKIYWFVLACLLVLAKEYSQEQ